MLAVTDPVFAPPVAANRNLALRCRLFCSGNPFVRVLFTSQRLLQSMSAIRDLPEIAGLDGRRSMVRIPPELDVPLTDRVRRILDTTAFRRLARISQLGLVSLVYPAAIHTRLEHSLGVFRLALLYLQQLSHDERFAAAVSAADAQRFMAAALLHDLGHWPFCHPIEDIRLAGVPRHEEQARSFLAGGEIADLLRADWRVEPSDVAAACWPASRATGGSGFSPACFPARSTSTRWTTCSAIACTPAFPTAAISISSGSSAAFA